MRVCYKYPMPLKSPVLSFITGPGNNRPKSWTCWFGPSLCKSNGFLLMTITVPSNNFCAFNWPTSVCWQKMLRYEPSKRITARQALEHEYFKDLEMVQWHASVVLWCVGICMSWVARFIPFYEPLYSLSRPPYLCIFVIQLDISNLVCFEMYSGISTRLPPWSLFVESKYPSHVYLLFFQASMVSFFVCTFFFFFG